MTANRSGFFKEYEKIKSPVSREILAKHIYELFQNIKLNELILLITNIFEEIVQYGELSNGGNTCQNLSLLFNPHRFMIGSYNKKDIYSSLKDERFSEGLARAVIDRRYDKKVSIEKILLRIFQLGVNGRIFASDFLPHVARDLAIKYGCNSDSLVLDPLCWLGGEDDWNIGSN